MTTPSWLPCSLLALCSALMLAAASEAAAAVQSHRVIAQPGESGLRAALSQVADGGVVVVTTNIELQAAVRVSRSVTIRYGGPRPWDNGIYGYFEGSLFELEAPEIAFEGFVFWGSPRTDAFMWVASGGISLRSCTVTQFRTPMAGESWWTSGSVVRLDGVTVANNAAAFDASRLEATNSVFANNQRGGAAAGSAFITGCVFEGNGDYGFLTSFGTVRDSVFRFNAGFGIHFDPDPGVLNLSGSLFYANAGGGLLVREQGSATVDNCTFTRHTGPPAIVVSEADRVVFRHCTVSDNLVIGGGQPGLWPSYPKGAAVALMSGQVELQNCLVADNPSDALTNASGIVGQWTDLGGNVIGGSASLAFRQSDEGIMPFYLVPQPGSRALDAGRLSDLVRDGRGLSRLAGLRPDAGAVEANASGLVDSDADGIPDGWELFRGLNPADPEDARSDLDRDGSDAVSEFLAGTDPNDASSVQRIVSMEISPNPLGPDQPPQVQLGWSNVPGVDYKVQVSSNLLDWRDAPGYFWPNWSFYTTADSPAAFYRLIANRP